MATVSSVNNPETETKDSQPETVTVTIDQIVAMNIRYWRREAAMTQGHLGDLLGWSEKNVSAAERSADDNRDRRRFDAGTLTALSLALGVPLVALFFPPEDDGDGKRYVFPALPGDPEGDTEQDMADLLSMVVMPDAPGETRALDAYRHRFRMMATQYLDTNWAEEVDRLLRPAESGEARAARAAHLRSRRAELLRTAAELEDLAGILEAGAK